MPKKTQAEKTLQKKCMLLASEYNLIPYHFEAVNVRLPSGEYKRSGVPVGWPDLTIINPKNGKVAFAELKVGYNKRSKEQIDISFILPNTKVCRTVAEFKKHLKECFNI